MIIIESIAQFTELNLGDKLFIHPIFKDSHLHPRHVDNGLSVLYMRDITEDQTYVLPFDHTDTTTIPVDKLYELIRQYIDPATAIYTISKKHLSVILDHDNIFDLTLLNYFLFNRPLSNKIDALIFDFYERTHPNLNNLNTTIPIMKLIEYCDQLYDSVHSLLVSPGETLYNIPAYWDVYTKYNNDAIDAYSQIEQYGIRVNDKILDVYDQRVEKHISNGRVYSDYNLFTTTGRPSNAFGSINFAALSSAQRECFDASDGCMLVEYDYDAYHLRLIADLMRYNLPESSAHEYFGKQYFKTDKLTSEQYEESKQITFKIMYGGISKEIAESIPFFNSMQKFIHSLWAEFNTHKFLETHIYNRRLLYDNFSEINRDKIFNYYVQAYETERNITIIRKLHELLETKNTNLILYGYDSFIFDFDISDGIELLRELRKIIETHNNNKFSSKIKAGKNYGNMKNITEKI